LGNSAYRSESGAGMELGRDLLVVGVMNFSTWSNLATLERKDDATTIKR